MAENSKIPCNVCVTQDVCRSRGECVQKDAWPETAGICKHCGTTKEGHYHGVTGIYCIGFYHSTKIFMPAEPTHAD